MKLTTLAFVLVVGCAIASASASTKTVRRTPPAPVAVDLATMQINQALDVFEDATQKAGAAKPQIVSGATVRKVANFRRQAGLRITRAPSCDDACKSDVGVALFRLMADPSLSDAELNYLQPYSNLVKAKLDIR